MVSWGVLYRVCHLPRTGSSVSSFSRITYSVVKGEQTHAIIAVEITQGA